MRDMTPARRHSQAHSSHRCVHNADPTFGDVDSDASLGQAKRLESFAGLYPASDRTIHAGSSTRAYVWLTCVPSVANRETQRNFDEPYETGHVDERLAPEGGPLGA